MYTLLLDTMHLLNVHLQVMINISIMINQINGVNMPLYLCSFHNISSLYTENAPRWN